MTAAMRRIQVELLEFHPCCQSCGAVAFSQDRSLLRDINRVVDDGLTS